MSERTLAERIREWAEAAKPFLPGTGYFHLCALAAEADAMQQRAEAAEQFGVKPGRDLDYEYDATDMRWLEAMKRVCAPWAKSLEHVGAGDPDGAITCFASAVRLEAEQHAAALADRQAGDAELVRRIEEVAPKEWSPSASRLPLVAWELLRNLRARLTDGAAAEGKP
jgi:hypothetical protein